MEHWGDEKGKAFFQRLAAQNASIRSGHSQMAQLIIAGEDALSPNAYSHHFPRAMVKGAPVDWTNLEPVIGKSVVTAMAKNAPHPHATMLFIDFFFNKDGGQKVVHDANRIGTHPELLPDPPRLRQGFDFIVMGPAKYMDKIGPYEKLWRDWVLGGK
jgi:iron(III) transport system substrate-binding protein